MRVLLQFPEGLKKLALEKTRELEEKGVEVIVSSSPCYGACDLAIEEAKATGAEKIIHYGHSKMAEAGEKQGVKIEYEEYPIEINARKIAEKIAEKVKFEKIGLLTTVQHAKQLGEIKKLLEEKGKKVLIGKGKRTKYDGQILGCEYDAAASVETLVDCFAIICGGRFHFLGIETSKPVFHASTDGEKIEEVSLEIMKMKKRMKGMLLKALEAKNFGVIVSTKIGQKNLEKAREIKKKLEAKGRNTAILVSNEVNFESLKNFHSFDCFINTACPRISEDYERLEKPVINTKQAEEMLEMI
ncbi:diphthamide biosynthesis enzyme Dph2 [Candidatus Micrarchaeota archaeon]|nr:diphthamide biosynthesis enzyme Dph2 [Candidatus Micrarchaeota archaeon]